MARKASPTYSVPHRWRVNKNTLKNYAEKAGFDMSCGIYKLLGRETLRHHVVKFPGIVNMNLETNENREYSR